MDISVDDIVTERMADCQVWTSLLGICPGFSWQIWDNTNLSKYNFCDIANVVDLVHLDDFQMCADAFIFLWEDEEYFVYHAGEDISLWIENNLHEHPR